MMNSITTLNGVCSFISNFITASYKYSRRQIMSCAATMVDEWSITEER